MGKPVNEFASLDTKKLIEQEDNAKLTFIEKEAIYEAVPSFADKMMRLHGMKPPNAKSWRSFAYKGKGRFDIDSIIKKTIMEGKFVLREKRRTLKNPEPPEIALITDISASITYNGLTKAEILLGCILAEIFGRGFAKKFHLGFIGAYNDSETYGSPIDAENLPILRDVDYEDVKRTLTFGLEYYSSGTCFIPVFEGLERIGFYRSRKIKFVFLITDGTPEAYVMDKNFTNIDNITTGVESMQGRYDPDRTRNESVRLSEYLELRWERDKTLLYFWIQIGKNRNLLHFLFQSGYVPPEHELLQYAKDDYEEILGGNDTYNSVYSIYNRPHSAIYELLKFYWKSHKKESMVYLSIASLKSGEAFHTLMKYLLRKFSKELDI